MLQHCDDAMELRAREVYSPRQHAGEEEELTTPKARTPLQSRRYILQETPYLSSLQEALDRALCHPVSYHNKLRHLLMLTISEQVTLPVILVRNYLSVMCFRQEIHVMIFNI